MAIKFVQSIDLGQNQILNLQLQNLASDPGSPVKGQIWINTVGNILKYYDGSAVQTLGELTNALNQFAAPTASLSMGSQTITSLGTPVNPTDAATKQYVDNAVIGLDIHASVKCATTTAGTLSSSFANAQTVDGITLVTGDRILIKNQSSGSDNGIYTVNASGAPTRATDCNSSTNYTPGAFVFVEEGTANQGGSFVVSTQGTITVGTTSVSWVQFSGASSTATALSGGLLGSIPYQSAASTTSMLAGQTTNGTYALVEVVTGSAAVAPTFSNAPALSAANMTSFPTLNQNTSGTAAGLSGSPSITVSAITDSGISTAGLVTSSSVGLFSGTGKSLTGAGAAVPTVPSTSVSGNVVTFTGTAGQIADSGTALSSLAPLVSPSFTTPTLGVASATSLTLSTALAVAQGGTGSTTAAGARSNIGATTKYATTFGDGSTTSYVITHSLGTTDVIVDVSNVATPYQVVWCDIQLTSTNTVTLVFAVAPSTNSLRVVVIG